MLVGRLLEKTGRISRWLRRVERARVFDVGVLVHACLVASHLNIVELATLGLVEIAACCLGGGMGEAFSITKAAGVFLTIIVDENRQQRLTTRATR